jgi:uncharacterized membrane protein
MSTPVDAHAERLVMERLVLFTDAVFAIVITLMAIEIRLPAGHLAGGWTEAALGHALAGLQPQFMAYFISFAVIALIWTGHLRKYRHLQAVDGGVLWLNLAQLLFIGLLPFLTSVLAEALNRLAIVLYAGNLVAAGTAGLLAWRRASASPVMAAPTLTPALRLRESRITLAMVLVFTLSIVLAIWWPAQAMLSWLLVWPALVLARRLTPDAPSPVDARAP